MFTEELEKGKNLLEKKQFEFALRCFQDLNKNQPKNSEILFYIGVCCKNLGKYQETLEYFLKADENRPKHADTLGNIGVCYIKLVKYQEALEYFLKADENRPEHADTLFNIGVCYESLGKYQEALKYYFKMLQLSIGCRNYAGIKTISYFMDQVYSQIKDVKNSDKLLDEIVAIYKDERVKAAIQKAIEYEERYPKPPQNFLVRLGGKILKMYPRNIEDAISVFERSSFEPEAFFKLGENILCIENTKHLSMEKRYWLALRCFCRADNIKGAQRARDVCFKGIVYGDDITKQPKIENIIGLGIGFENAEHIIEVMRAQHQKTQELTKRNEELNKIISKKRKKTFFKDLEEPQELNTQEEGCRRQLKGQKT